MTRISFKILSLSVVTLMAFVVAASAADPGTPIPTGATNDQQPASVLVYNLYTSSASDPHHDTKINITNESLAQGTVAHLFFN